MPGSWEVSKGLAGEILRQRGDRRRMMARLLVLLLGVLGLGLWVINGWLAHSVWRFLIWWGGCALLTCWLLLLALYDALAVVREERDAVRAGREKNDGNDG